MFSHLPSAVSGPVKRRQDSRTAGKDTHCQILEPVHLEFSLSEQRMKYDLTVNTVQISLYQRAAEDQNQIQVGSPFMCICSVGISVGLSQQS